MKSANVVESRDELVAIPPVLLTGNLLATSSAKGGLRGPSACFLWVPRQEAPGLNQCTVPPNPRSDKANPMAMVLFPP
ncbi:MAG: hypothetical protein CM15mP77_1730 [Synechococcus sp.]|nr:MAG: hypothetical protein CM15mP77_1730 [Synechococcus sp.]